MINEKISKAVKARHANTAPEVLAERMAHASRVRWSRVSKVERTEMARALVTARIEKYANAFSD